MEFAQHVSVFSGIVSFFMIGFCFLWSSNGIANCFVKTFLAAFGVYGLLIFLESSKFFSTLRIF